MTTLKALGLALVASVTSVFVTVNVVNGGGAGGAECLKEESISAPAAPANNKPTIVINDGKGQF